MTSEHISYVTESIRCPLNNLTHSPLNDDCFRLDLIEMGTNGAKRGLRKPRWSKKNGKHLDRPASTSTKPQSVGTAGGGNAVKEEATHLWPGCRDGGERAGKYVQRTPWLVCSRRLRLASIRSIKDLRLRCEFGLLISFILFFISSVSEQCNGDVRNPSPVHCLSI